MGTIIPNTLPHPHDVWGVEALDPLEQKQWVEKLWNKMQPQHLPIPLLLLHFTPSAERMLIRCLRTFARIGWHQSLAVFFSTPGDLPLINRTKAESADLIILHRGSRMIDLPEWLTKKLLKRDCKMILTVPEDELEAVLKLPYQNQVAVPQEEHEYCEQSAREILQTCWQEIERDDPYMPSLLQILSEAGVAGVDVPLTLIASYLNIELSELSRVLGTPGLQHFVRYSSCAFDEKSCITFRGRWLAEKIIDRDSAEYYPHLTELLEYTHPVKAQHRIFAINFLMALRAQSRVTQVEALQKEYRHLFNDFKHYFVDKNETIAWRLLRRHDMLRWLFKFFSFTHHKKQPSPAFNFIN